MKKGENLVKNYMIFADEESQIGSLTINGNFFKRAIRPKLLSFLFLSLLSCTLIWTPQLFGFPPTYSFLCK